MAIDLLNSFLQRGQKISSESKNTTSKMVQITQNMPQNLQVMRAIRALQAGQTIQGEVVFVKGEEIRLAIMKDLIIDARLAQNMNLTPGVTMPFQVKANTGQGLSLIPLFTNTAADPNVLKALGAAQIPVNERSVEMVQNLMEKGMPIDKQSIQEMYREVVAFKDAAVKDLVSLHQMKLPVTQENLTQFSLYQNNQHYLEDAFSNIGSVIGEYLGNLVAEGKVQEAGNLLQQLQQVFQNEESIVIENGEKKSITDENLITDGGRNTENLQESKTVQKAGANVVSEEMIVHGEKNPMTSENIQQSKTIQQSETIQPSETIQSSEKKTAENEKQIVQENISDSDTILKTEKNVEALKNQEVKESISDAKNNLKQPVMWKELTDVLLNEKSPDKLAKIFEKVWNKEVSAQWMMEPETVMEKKNVKEFYEKLNSQIRQLEKIFDEAGMTKSPAARVIQNTASNLDFMNQLNQMHAYIQLPLKMTNQNTHGELYVFTNKRNHAKQDGKVTALLHLDMENLGKMDVYVALEDKKVSTNFYLEKEEYLDFLEEHMDWLTARLNKRGYTCDVKTMLRTSEEESIIRTIQKQQDQPMLLSMQAFDVRA